MTDIAPPKNEQQIVIKFLRANFTKSELTSDWSNPGLKLLHVYRTSKI